MSKITQERTEKLKQLRRDAYQKMKEKQKSNPVFIVMQETQRQRRREIYASFKEKSKKLRLAVKKDRKEVLGKIKQEERSVRDQELMSSVMADTDSLKIQLDSAEHS